MDSKKSGKKIKLSYLIGICVFAFVIIPIAVVGVFTGVVARGALIKQAYSFSIQMLDNKAHQLEDRISIVHASANRLLTDFTVQQYSRTHQNSQIVTIPEEEVRNLFHTLQANHQLENIDMILWTGKIISTRDADEVQRVFTDEALDSLMSLPREKGSETDVSAILNGGGQSDPKIFSVLMPVYDTSSDSNLGLLARVIISYTIQLNDVHDPPVERGESEMEYTLISGQNEILNVDHQNMIPPEVVQTILDSKDASGYFTRFVDSNNHLYTFRRLTDYGWVLVSDTVLKNYDLYVSTISWNFFLVFLVIVLLSLAVTWAVAAFLLVPFERVIKSLQEIREGSFDWRTQHSGSFVYELDSLTHWFNQFVRNEQGHKQVEADLIESERRYHSLFDDSPIALWEEDFSGIIHAIDELGLSVNDLNSYLLRKPEEVNQLISKLKILDVNRATLKLFKAESKEQLLADSSFLFSNVNPNLFRQEIVEMAKRTAVYEVVLENNTFAKDVLNVRMRWSVLPGYESSMERVIVSTQDITSELKENLLKSTIMQIVQEASGAGTLQELYQSIHWALAKIMPADNLFIALYDEETGLVSFPYFVDQQDEKPEPRMFSNGWTEHVIRSGKPVLVSPEEISIFEDEYDLQTVGTESIDWLGVPLIVKDRTIGAIVAQTYEIGTRYTREHAEWLTLASTQIAMAIDRKQAEEALKYSSTHDKLTGLYNRAYFETEVARLSTGRQNPIGVIMLDVDGLKKTNDTYGHSAGDELLRRSGKVLMQVFRTSDMVARIGGDEFVILLPQSDQKVVKKAIQRIEKVLEENNAKPSQAKLSLSIGFCCTSAKIDLREAIKNADHEMYTHKSRRKQQIQV